MPFLLVGVNHKTCPLETREKFFLQPVEVDLLLAEFKNDPRILAAFVLSTCNRTEIYLDLMASDPFAVFKIFFDVKHLPLSERLEHYFYVRREEAVVAHLFRVVTGLDSLVLGEKQILGQVKDALKLSRDKQMLNRAFNILANKAVETGRKVRRETQIDYGGSSVSWAAVTKAEQVLGSLAGKVVLVMGAGKMSALAIQQLHNKDVGKVYIMNRTEDKAEVLARQCRGEAVPFWKIRDVLVQADVCICSTGAPHYLVDRELMESVMAQRPERKLAAIDIAVPRNIDPHASGVPGVSLVAVDDLSLTVQDNMNRRMSAIAQVEEIIRIKADEFYRALDKAAMFEMLNSQGDNKEARIQ